MHLDLNKALLSMGALGWITTLTNLHEALGVMLQFTGLLSFLLYILINWDKIIHSGNKRYLEIKRITKWKRNGNNRRKI